MRIQETLRWAAVALVTVLLFGGAMPDARAQGNCMTFSEARKAGLSSGLRSAAAVKSEVEARTGGKVVSFLICRPGPIYKLTVLHPGGNVSNVTVPAR